MPQDSTYPNRQPNCVWRRSPVSGVRRCESARFNDYVPLGSLPFALGDDVWVVGQCFMDDLALFWRHRVERLHASS